MCCQCRIPSPSRSGLGWTWVGSVSCAQDSPPPTHLAQRGINAVRRKKWFSFMFAELTTWSSCQSTGPRRGKCTTKCCPTCWRRPTSSWPTSGGFCENFEHFELRTLFYQPIANVSRTPKCPRGRLHSEQNDATSWPFPDKMSHLRCSSIHSVAHYPFIGNSTTHFPFEPNQADRTTLELGCVPPPKKK